MRSSPGTNQTSRLRSIAAADEQCRQHHDGNDDRKRDQQIEGKSHFDAPQVEHRPNGSRILG
jgi:hypothetical protein